MDVNQDSILGTGANLKALLKPVDKSKTSSKKGTPQSSQDNSASDANAPLLPPKPLREQARALFQYTAQNDDELTFKEDDIITIISKDIEDKGWWKGELNGRIGVFPDNFIEIIKPQANSPENDVTLPPRKRYDILKPPPPPPPPSGKHISSSNAAPTGSPLAKSDSKADVVSNNKGSAISRKSATICESSASEEDSKLIATAASSPLFRGKKSKFGSGNSVMSFVKSASLNSPKPDVVPQEISNRDKAETDMDEVKNINNVSTGTGENSDINLGSLDSCGKLTHLTVNRARAPRDRRPPSVIGALRDSESEECKQSQLQDLNGDPKTDSSKNDGKISLLAGANTGPGGEINYNIKGPQFPPWMVELRKNQAERRSKTDSTIIDDSKETKPSTPVSPTRPNFQRFSGDFTLKSEQITKPQSSVPSSTNIISDPIATATSQSPQSLPMSILKPARTSKPSSTTSSSVPSPHGSPIMSGTPPKSASSSSVSSMSINGASGAAGKLQTESVVISKELGDLQNELKNLKKSFISRKEYDELVKKVDELKEIMDSVKDSYGSVVRELINEVAEVRKTMANLEIEVDRLRKLSTTV